MARDSPASRHWRCAGWSVMVSVPVDRQRAGCESGAVLELMVDLGVDIRTERPEELLSLHAGELEAVIVSGVDNGIGLPLRRPDGSSIPVVDHGDDSAVAMVTRVAAVARRRVVPSNSAERDPVAGSPQVLTTDDAAPPEVAYVEAGVRIRDEYREFLEQELARTQADLEETNAAFRRLVTSFDEKERYIDSLLSVRVKKWILSRRRGREI